MSQEVATGGAGDGGLNPYPHSTCPQVFKVAGLGLGLGLGLWEMHCLHALAPPPQSATPRHTHTASSSRITSTSWATPSSLTSHHMTSPPYVLDDRLPSQPLFHPHTPITSRHSRHTPPPPPASLRRHCRPTGTEAWFASTIRTDVNGGVRTREDVTARDPRLATGEMCVVHIYIYYETCAVLSVPEPRVKQPAPWVKQPAPLISRCSRR